MTFTLIFESSGFEEHPSMSVGKVKALCHDAATECRRRCKQQATIWLAWRIGSQSPAHPLRHGTSDFAEGAEYRGYSKRLWKNKKAFLRKIGLFRENRCSSPIRTAFQATPAECARKPTADSSVGTASALGKAHT
jgi:hypothetical protein